LARDDDSPDRLPLLQRGIRASSTHSTVALWSKSLLNALLFFAIFMLALPWGAHRILPAIVPVAQAARTAIALVLSLAGIATWLFGLDAFSRRGRGTPLALDAPRLLVTDGPFARSRNPIMLGELVVIWSVALHLGSVGVFLYAGLVTALAHWLVIHVEEPELRRRFGASYSAYCERVPRWLGRSETG